MELYNKENETPKKMNAFDLEFERGVKKGIELGIEKAIEEEKVIERLAIAKKTYH